MWNNVVKWIPCNKCGFLSTLSFFYPQWSSLLPSSNIWFLWYFLLRDLSQIITLLLLIFCVSYIYLHIRRPLGCMSHKSIWAFLGVILHLPFSLSIHSLPFWVVAGEPCLHSLGPSYWLTSGWIWQKGTLRYEWGQEEREIDIHFILLLFGEQLYSLDNFWQDRQPFLLLQLSLALSTLLLPLFL